MGVFRTRDFTALSPTYEDAGGSLNGVVTAMMLDPYSPRDVSYVLTESGFWRTQNLNDSYPGWGQMMAITDKISAGLSPALYRLQTTIAAQGRLYALAWAKESPTATSQKQYVLKSDNGGATWSVATLTGGGTAAGYGYFPFGDFPAAAISLPNTSAINPQYFLNTVSNCVDYCRINGEGYIVVDLGSEYTISNIITKAVEVGINAFTTVYSGPDVTGPWTTRHAAARPHAGCNVYSGWPAPSSPYTTRYLRFWAQGFALGNYREYYVMEAQIESGPTPVALTPTYALAAGQHNANRVYSADGQAIRRSSNAGTSWSSYIAQGAHDIECHYAGNTQDDDLRFIGTDGKFYTTVGSTATLRSGWGTETPANVPGRIVTFTNSASIIYTLFHDGSDLFSVKRSLDGGATWSTMSSNHANARAIGLWPYNSDIVYMLTDDGPLYSVDGGATFANKTGNLAGFSGQVYIVPVWIS